jgi:hypothetical protein
MYGGVGLEERNVHAEDTKDYENYVEAEDVGDSHGHAKENAKYSGPRGFRMLTAVIGKCEVLFQVPGS